VGFETKDTDDGFGGLGPSDYIRNTDIGWQSSGGGTFSMGSSTKFPCCGTKMT
jgi:hypothetical protein